jgi:hypothetical protein
MDGQGGIVFRVEQELGVPVKLVGLVKVPTIWRRSSRPPSSTPCSAETPCTATVTLILTKHGRSLLQQQLRKVLVQVIRQMSDGLSRADRR